METLIGTILGLVGGAVRQMSEKGTSDQLRGLLSVYEHELRSLLKLAGDVTESDLRCRLESTNAKINYWQSILDGAIK